MKRRKRRAFTLIEMLAVIAIMGLLAALLVPALAGGRDKARRTKCAANLRQIWLGITAYVDDHDNVTPKGYDGDWVTACWRSRILPYHQAYEIYLCPGAPDKARKHRARANYGINAYIGEMNGGVIKLDAIAEPSKTIYVGENGDADWVVEPIGGRWPNPGLWYPCHGDGSTVLWVDGHVDWLSTTNAHASDFYFFRPDKNKVY